MPSPPCLSPPISSPASSFIITLTELVTPLPGDTHYSYGLGHLFHSLPSFAYMCRLAGKFWLPEITKLSLPLTMLKNQLIPPSFLISCWSTPPPPHLTISLPPSDSIYGPGSLANHLLSRNWADSPYFTLHLWSMDLHASELIPEDICYIYSPSSIYT